MESMHQWQDETDYLGVTRISKSSNYFNGPVTVCDKQGHENCEIEFMNRQFEPLCQRCLQDASPLSDMIFSLSEILNRIDQEATTASSLHDFQNVALMESKSKVNSVICGFTLIQKKIDSPKHSLANIMHRFESDFLKPTKQISQLATLLQQIPQVDSLELLEISLQKLRKFVTIKSFDQVEIIKDEESAKRRRAIAMNTEAQCVMLKEVSLLLFKIINLVESLSSFEVSERGITLSPADEAIIKDAQKFIDQQQEKKAIKTSIENAKEIKLLQAKLVDASNNYKDLEDKYNQSQQCVFDLSSELEKVSQILQLTGQLNSFRTRKSDSSHRETASIEERSKLKSEISQLKLEIQNLKIENENLKEEISNIKEESHGLQNDLDIFTQQKQRLEQENLLLATQSEQADKFKSLSEKLTNNLEEMKYSNLISQKKLTDQISLLEETKSELEKQIVQLQRKFEETSLNLREKDKRSQDYEAEISRLHLEIQKKASEVQNKSVELSNALESLRNVHSMQSTSQVEQREIVIRLKDEIRQLTEAVEAEQRKAAFGEKSKEESIAQLKQQYTQAQEQITQQREKIRDLTEDRKYEADEISKLKDTIKECKTKIQLDERNITKLESEIKTLTNSMKQAYKQINENQSSAAMRQSKVGFTSGVTSRRGSNEGKSTSRQSTSVGNNHLVTSSKTGTISKK